MLEAQDADNPGGTFRREAEDILGRFLNTIDPRLARELTCEFLSENSIRVDEHYHSFSIEQTWRNYKLAVYHGFQSNLVTLHYSRNRFFLYFTPYGWNSIARVLLLRKNGLEMG
jgi:hypothetical protein